MGKKYTDAGAYPMYMDVQTNAPLDNRMVVEHIADLTNGSIQYPYYGLTVYVIEDKNLYVCTKFDPLDDITTEWKVVSEQADWEETDPQSSSFIKNKPEVYTKEEINEVTEDIYGEVFYNENAVTRVEYKSNAIIDDISTTETQFNTQLLESGGNKITSPYYISSKVFPLGGVYKGVHFSDYQYELFKNKKVKVVIGIAYSSALKITDVFEITVNNKDVTSYSGIHIPAPGAIGIVNDEGILPNYKTDAVSGYKTYKGEKHYFEDDYKKYTLQPSSTQGMYFPFNIEVEANIGLTKSIKALIPSTASEENQLADKDFVNSSIATNTAEYISNNGLPFSSVAELQAYTGPHDNNDYAFVKTLDALGNEVYYRYKFSGATGQWGLEYKLNNSSFTAAQWEAINSMITSGLVAKLQALPTAAELTAEFANKQNTLTFDQQPTEGSTNPVTSNGISNAIKTSYMKWGVTSQKQNWTKAADDGYDYTMSNITYGYIPQANIDLFESAGAVFNEESGYFELNGLTDISYKEMMDIYRRIEYMNYYTSGDSVLFSANIPRTFIYNLKNNATTTQGSYFRYFHCFESFGRNDRTLYLYNGNISYSFYNSMFGLKNINVIIICQENTNLNSTCFQCPSLELVKIQSLNKNIDFHRCARLNYESIRYLIDNATDSVKTVTVHPTTYDYLTGAAEPTARVGGTSEEWQQLVTDATEKNISFATNS